MMTSLNRRQLLVLTAAAAAAGCDGDGETPGPRGTHEPTPAASTAASAAAEPPATSAATGGSDDTAVDAGAVATYDADGVYDQFRQEGFFVIRRAGELFAMSSVCTHKGCKVRAQADESFLCKCHGSRFDREGKVTKPPARRDLPRLPVALDDARHVLVKVPAKTAPGRK